MLKTKKISFTLDRHSQEPMTAQLMQQIKGFIDSVPEGTRFPSERNIAKELKINRVTIQAAMQPFVDSGEMRRYGNRGTFVFPQKVSEIPKLHPMQMEDIYSLRKAKVPLKLMIYEDYRFQREFWESCVDQFQKTYPRIPLQIIWVPQKYSNETYGEYIAEEKPDLIQTFFHPMRCRLLAKLPKAFMNRLSREFFCTEHIHNEIDSLFGSLVPVYFSPIWQFIDLELAEKYGIKAMIPRFKKEGFLQVLPDIMKTAPRSLGANTLWKYFSYAGNRPVEDSHAAFKQIGELYDLVDRYACQGIRFKTDGSNASDGFADEKELFSFDNYLNFNIRIGTTPLKYSMTFPPLGKDIRIHSGTSCLGINKDSLKIPESLLFLEFMLSEKVQDRIPEKLSSFAFRRSSNLYYVRQGIIAEENLKMALSSTVSYYHYPFLFLPPYMDELRKYFNEYVNGQCNRKDAEALSELQYKAIYKEHLQDFVVTNWHYFAI